MSIGKIIEIAVGVLLTLLVLTWILGMYFKVGPLQNLSSKQTETTVQALTTSTYSEYNNHDVMGADVISAIDTKASKDVAVKVETTDGAVITYNAASYNLTDSTDTGYIEPTASFHSTLGYTTNGTVDLITFVQNTQSN